MGFLSSVTKENKVTPPRVVVHGIGSIGKTTFGADAAEMNNGVFLLGEDGLSPLKRENIPRMPQVKSYEEYQAQLTELIVEKHDYKTVVIDTQDAIIPLLDKYVVDKFYGGDQDKADNYKRKYGDYSREFSKVLMAYDQLAARGIQVIVLVHSVVENHRDPASESWKRWEMKLPGGDKTSLGALLYDWADVVLFATYDVNIQKDGRATGDRRVAYTEWDAAYDAKNRYSLPSKIPFDYKAFSELMAKSGRKA